MENGPNGHSGGGGGTRKQPTPAPALTLERVIGQTCLHNSALAVNPVTGDVAYPAGCVVVIYQPRHNRQSRFFHSTKAVSCLAFSADGTYLAVGERGHQPSIVVWSLGSGVVIAELKNGHRFGVSCLTFSPAGNLLVSAGFKYDRQMRVWDLESAIAAAASPAAKNSVNNMSNTNADKTSSKSFDPSSCNEDRRPSFLLASAKVSQKVRSVVFGHDGAFFVTCGDRHVKFWTIEVGGIGKKSEEAKEEEEEEEQPTANGTGIVAITLTGRPASTLEGLSDSIFMDIACCQGEDGINTVYAVTSSAVLCVFSTQCVMEQWVDLEAENAYGLSVCDRLLCIGCSNGILRLFDAGSLQFIATLPKPPPLGRANVASTRELKTLIDSHASSQVGTEQNNKQQQQHVAVGLSYASVLGVRLSPSRTKVVAVYADCTFVMWDITDTHNVGKYRSSLSHSACIWDIQCIPSRSCSSSSDDREVPMAPLSIPAGTFVTCSADNTIRVWNINSLDGSSATRDGVEGEEAAASTVSKTWVNLYSQHLLRILYVNSLDGGMSEVPSHNSLSAECGGGGQYEHENAKEKRTTSSSQSYGIPDVETLPTSNSPVSPRSLAVHPDGLQLACGDKQGNIRIYDLHDMKLMHSQAAHDGEVLCMDYSPVMELQTVSHAAGARTDEVVGSHNGESWLAVRPYHPFIISPWNANSNKAADTDSSAMPENLKGKDQLVLLASASRDRLVHIFHASGRIEKDEDGNKKLLNSSSYPLLETISDHTSSVTAVKFSKDGRRIATAGGDKTLILNDVRGSHIHKFKTISVPQGTIYGLDVDPTSKYLISTGQDKKVNIWSMATGNLARTYSPGGGGGSWGEMYKVDLDPTGIYAAMCSFDKYIRLFDFYSGRCFCKVSGHSELVTGIRFSLDGRRLVSIGGDGCIFIWRLSTSLQQAMHDRLCELYPECVISENRGGEVGGVGNEPGGRASPVNRTRAKEDAKARLKLHKSQLPVWAEMVKQPTTPNDVENANSGVINNLSQQVTTTQGESESDSSDTFEGIKSSPKGCNRTAWETNTSRSRWAPKLQQEGGGNVVHARPPIDNRFSQEKLIESADDIQSSSNRFEGLSSHNSEGCGGLEEKTCAGEGVDGPPQQEMPCDDRTVAAVVDVTYGWKEMSVQEDIDRTTIPVQDVVNEELIEEKKERGGSYYESEVVLSMAPSNLAPETLHTPSKLRPMLIDGIRTDSTKCNSEIEDAESLACCLNNDTLADSKNGKSVERAKIIDESSTEMGVVVEVQKDNEEAAAILPTQESCCFTDSDGVKGGTKTEKEERPRVSSCKIRESASTKIKKEGGISIDISYSKEDDAKFSKAEEQSMNEMNNNLNQSNEQMLLHDSGLCTAATATAGSNSKTAGFRDDATLTPLDSFALELPLPPGFSQDKDVREEQDKGISRMHAKRKETEVGRMR